MRSRTRSVYTVTHPNCTPITLIRSTAQAAVRSAFRIWILSGELSRQPQSTDGGGFEGVEVELRRLPN